MADKRGNCDADTVKGILATKWLWGQDTKKVWCQPTRNGLPQLKLLCSGTLRLLVFLPSKFPEDLKSLSIDDVVEHLKNISSENFEKLKSACFECTLNKFEMILLPTGCIVAEQCTSATLLFGLRVGALFKGLHAHTHTHTPTRFESAFEIFFETRVFSYIICLKSISATLSTHVQKQSSNSVNSKYIPSVCMYIYIYMMCGCIRRSG